MGSQKLVAAQYSLFHSLFFILRVLIIMELSHFLITASCIIIPSLPSFVVLNGALNLPLIATSTSGVLGYALAAVGALKLGTSLFLLSQEIGGQDQEVEEGYDRYFRRRRTRYQRSLPEAVELDSDALFQLVSNLDRNSCAKQLVCELGAIQESSGLVSQEEAGIMALFSADNAGESSAVSSARAQYDLAVSLGRRARSVQVCRHRYADCPFTANKMMEAVSKVQF